MSKLILMLMLMPDSEPKPGGGLMISCGYTSAVRPENGFLGIFTNILYVNYLSAFSICPPALVLFGMPRPAVPPLPNFGDFRMASCRFFLKIAPKTALSGYYPEPSLARGLFPVLFAPVRSVLFRRSARPFLCPSPPRPAPFSRASLKVRLSGRISASDRLTWPIGRRLSRPAAGGVTSWEKGLRVEKWRLVRIGG